MGLRRVEVTEFNLASLLAPSHQPKFRRFSNGGGGSEKDTEPLLGPSLGIRE